MQGLSALLVTRAHLLFQDLPDLEDVDTGEPLEDPDKVISRVLPLQRHSSFPPSLVTDKAHLLDLRVGCSVTNALHPVFT